MDGTLTIPVHDFEQIRETLGIPSGTPILEAIDQMPPDEAAAVSKKLHDLEMELAYQAEPQPDAVEVLDHLHRLGKNLAILTRNGEEIARATLQAAGLGHYFTNDTLIGRETCAPKPLPDGVLHLLSMWGADANQSVIVGDYLYDIQAGFDAGINTVHFDSEGRFPWPQYAHHKIQRLADLKRLA